MYVGSVAGLFEDRYFVRHGALQAQGLKGACPRGGILQLIARGIRAHRPRAGMWRDGSQKVKTLENKNPQAQPFPSKPVDALRDMIAEWQWTQPSPQCCQRFSRTHFLRPQRPSPVMAVPAARDSGREAADLVSANRRSTPIRAIRDGETPWRMPARAVRGGWRRRRRRPASVPRLRRGLPTR
jgi:hypothetical protein